MRYIFASLAALGLLFLTACDRDADVASYNLSLAADSFEVHRRIVFYNGITSEYILEIEGKCSIEDQRNQLEVVCKVSEDQYKKHFLGLSDNVTYFAEQLHLTNVSRFHYRTVFKPQVIIPEIDLQTSSRELMQNRH